MKKEHRLVFDIAEYVELFKKREVTDPDMQVRNFIAMTTSEIAKKTNALGIQGEKVISIREESSGDNRIVVITTETFNPE